MNLSSSKPTVFVTGATGFLGSAVSRKLVEEGCSIVAIRRTSSRMGLLEELEQAITWHDGDILDPSFLAEAIEGCQAVFHCAAYVGFEGKKTVQLMNKVNVQGTANVVNAALHEGIERMVHVSSIAALGRSESMTQCLDETAEWVNSKMNTAYAVSKKEAEKEVQRGIAEGLNAVIVNPSVIMGPGHAGDNTMQIAEKVAQGKLPVIPSGGTNMVDVDDVADGIWRAFKQGKTGERYILSGNNLMWKEIIHGLAQSMKVSPPGRVVSRPVLMIVAAFIQFGSRLIGANPLLTIETARLSTSVSCYDNSKAIAELGCSFRPFQETADRIAQHMSS